MATQDQHGQAWDGVQACEFLLHIDSMDMSLSKLWELVIDREARHAAVHGITRSHITEQLNWTPSSDLPCCMVLFLAFCVLGCLCILKNPCGWGESALPGRPALGDRKGYSWPQAFDMQTKQPKAHVPRGPRRQQSYASIIPGQVPGN